MGRQCVIGRSLFSFWVGFADDERVALPRGWWGSKGRFKGRYLRERVEWFFKESYEDHNFIRLSNRAALKAISLMTLCRFLLPCVGPLLIKVVVQRLIYHTPYRIRTGGRDLPKFSTTGFCAGFGDANGVAFHSTSLRERDVWKHLRIRIASLEFENLRTAWQKELGILWLVFGVEEAVGY